MPAQTVPPVASAVSQTGNTNLNVTNEAGGVVNINYSYPKSNFTSGSAEELMAIQSFSTQYYQLIVTCEDSIFTNNMVTIPAERALSRNYVPDEILERCSPLSDNGIEELKTFPAIICHENTDLHGVTDPKQMAIYAYITIVQVEGKIIKVAFKPIRIFNQQRMCLPEAAIYFGLEHMDCAITELNHSAWYVHKRNLFQAFEEAGLGNMPRPNQ